MLHNHGRRPAHSLQRKCTRTGCAVVALTLGKWLIYGNSAGAPSPQAENLEFKLSYCPSSARVLIKADPKPIGDRGPVAAKAKRAAAMCGGPPALTRSAGLLVGKGNSGGKSRAKPRSEVRPFSREPQTACATLRVLSHAYSRHTWRPSVSCERGRLQGQNCVCSFLACLTPFRRPALHPRGVGACAGLRSGAAARNRRLC